MNTAEVLVSVEQYDRDPGRQSAELRSLLEKDQNSFLEAIATQGAGDAGNRGFRYALILLKNSGLLIPYLADSRRSSLQRALRLAKLMVGIDSDFPNELVRTLEAGNPILQTQEERIRVLDLILEVGGGVTNWRPLARLSASEDQRIKTRCVNIFARHRADSKTFATIYERSDTRTRADLIEIIGSDDQRDTGEVILKALADGNNRVAANACLAAYRTGDAGALQRLVDMCAVDEPLFRRSAIWAMGETRDPRFSETLRMAARSSDTKLRFAAQRSLTKLDRISAWNTNAAFSIVADFETPCCVDRSADVLRTVVVSLQGNTEAVSRERETDYILYSGAVPILSYKVQIAPQRRPASLRIACSTAALEELAGCTWRGLNISDTNLKLGRIAIYGPRDEGRAASIEKATGLKCTWRDSLRHAVGSLLDEPVNQSAIELCVIVDPVLPVDLPLSELERECLHSSIGFYAVEFDRGATRTGLTSFFPGEGAAFMERYLRGLVSGVRINFSGALSGLSLRIRQADHSGTTVSRTLQWG